MMIRVLALVLLGVAAVWSTCHSNSFDCEVEHGDWSECDPCTRLRSRENKVRTPAHFSGRQCPAAQSEVEACETEAPCPAELPCGERFSCGIVGKCLNRELVCNGDDDCGNNRDEEECDATQVYSRSQRACMDSLHVPYLDQLGQGIDMTTGRIVGRVLDHQRFNGLCRHAFDSGNTRGMRTYRMPYNIDDLRFAVDADNDIESTAFRSTKDLLQSGVEGDGTNLVVGFGIGIDYNTSTVNTDAGNQIRPAINLGFSRRARETSGTVYKTLERGNGTTMRFRNKVAIGQFVMRDRDLILDPYFAKKVHQLPRSFNARSYYDLFEQFGTSYIHSGSLGGVYEEYHTVSDDTMRELEMDERATQNCLGFGVGVGLGLELSTFSIPNVGVDFRQANCVTGGGTNVDVRDVLKRTTDKQVNLMGGTAEAAGQMMGAAVIVQKGRLERVKYESWVSSLKENPAVLDVQPRSVCSLFAYAEDKDFAVKQETCQAAMNAYLEPYSTRNCQPCLNGGLKINRNKVCGCACPHGFAGEACEQNLNPLQFSSSLANRALTVTDNLKLIVEDNTDMVVQDPPTLSELPVQPFDTVLKTQLGKVLLLSSDKGKFSFVNGKAVGNYAIKKYSEFLELEDVIPIDFEKITECLVEGTSCLVVDFDVDGEGKLLTSIKVQPAEGKTYTTIHRLDREGHSEMAIPRPCAEFDESDSAVSFVTALCDAGRLQKRMVVSCPLGDTATIKVYNNMGTVGLTQFEGYAPVTSLQYFHNQLWFHTAKGQVGSFDLDTLEPKFHHESEEAGLAYSQTQLFVDFAKNLIVGQTNREADKAAFTVVETETGRTLARVHLADWTNCAYVAAYRGKVFAKCYRRDNAANTAILVFDYLK